MSYRSVGLKKKPRNNFVSLSMATGLFLNALVDVRPAFFHNLRRQSI